MIRFPLPKGHSEIRGFFSTNKLFSLFVAKIHNNYNLDTSFNLLHLEFRFNWSLFIRFVNR